MEEIIRCMTRLVTVIVVSFPLCLSFPAAADNYANLFVPDEVLSLFKSAPKKQKLKYCKTGKGSYERVKEYSVNPPYRILGYNSRMDNENEVEGAVQFGNFVISFSTIYIDLLTKGDEARQQIALDALYEWASGSALLATKSCVNEQGIADRNCTSWKQPDGQDPSDWMDYNKTQIDVMHLAYGYYFTLASFKPMDPKHVVIKNWFDEFFKRNRRPKDVSFGLDLNYYWPKLFSILLQKEEVSAKAEAREILEFLLSELDGLLLDDGSIKDRTTRGNRALWYHHSSLAELMITLEMARRFDLPIPTNLDQRIQMAGEIFLEGFLDHSYLDKWAKVAYRGIFTPGQQEFPKSINLPNGNSWFYIYAFRYPNNPVAKRLMSLLKEEKPNIARRDGLVGFGLGCIYAVANDVR